MSHWHKLGFQAFLAREVMRKDTLPFAIGMGFVALMGLGLNASITEEDRKSSAYHKQLRRPIRLVPDRIPPHYPFLFYTHHSPWNFLYYLLSD